MVVNPLPRGLRRLWNRTSPAENAVFPDTSEALELAQGLSVSHHDDGLVALDPKSGNVFAANRLGALIWKQLEQRVPVDNIAAEISRTYRIGPALALDDLCRFLADLQRRGLLRAAQ
jgi:hypothetical protein